MFDLVHALADADAGSEMKDGIDAVERAAEGRAVAHVAHDEVGVWMKIGRTRGVAVHLRIQNVEHSYAVSARDEVVGEMRADEARAARDQDLHASVSRTRRHTGVVSRLLS